MSVVLFGETPVKKYTWKTKKEMKRK